MIGGKAYWSGPRFLLQKLPLNEIAKIRKLSLNTIISHIEKIAEIDTQLDLIYLKPTQERLEKIAEAFKKSGGTLLAPVRTILGEEYSYDEIRFAKIFLKL